MNNQTKTSKRSTSDFRNENDHSDEVTTYFYEYFDFPEEMPKIEPTESTLEKNFAGKDEGNDIFSLIEASNNSEWVYSLFSYFFDSLGIPAISLPGSDGGGSIQGGKTTFENFGTVYFTHLLKLSFTTVK